MGKKKTMEKQRPYHVQYRGSIVFGMLAPVKRCDIRRLKMLLKDIDYELDKMGKRQWKEYVQKLP